LFVCLFFFFSKQKADDIFPDYLNEKDPKQRFLNQLRRECRGIVFHKDPPHQVLSRRFHKFFNGKN